MRESQAKGLENSKKDIEIWRSEEVRGIAESEKERGEKTNILAPDSHNHGRLDRLDVHVRTSSRYELITCFLRELLQFFSTGSSNCITFFE